MKTFAYIFNLILLFVLSSMVSAQNISEERTVKAYAEVNASDPSITLHWENSSYALSYQIYRRSPDSSDWGTPVADLATSVSSWKDDAVSINTLYEYRIIRKTNITEPLSSSGAKMEAYAFLISGIQMEATHYRGKIAVLVAEAVHDSITSELNTLKYDLIGDGYQPSFHKIAKDATVEDVATLLRTLEDLKSIFLIGQVPYPYSGLYCSPKNYEYPPDGHHETAGAHCGAWIADVYYGCLDGQWTDLDSTTIASRAENDNLIGDGKFDNIRIPGLVVVEVGRADLSRLTRIKKSEIELTRQYLDKVHAYKHDQTPVIRKGIIENNFGSYAEGFSSAAIRDFYSHLGKGNTIYADLFTTTASNDYLMSYTCGAGSFRSCGGVGYTDSFNTNNPAMFNHMFGSYFGDYDVINNIGRASLASERGGLISNWSGRPKWITHGLAMGENYGAVTVRSQNNFWDYDVSICQNYAHISLLGDPSLRTSMFAPPSNLSLSTNVDSTHVYLSWTASSSSVTGYYVYWSTDEVNYVLLNESPTPLTTMTHYTASNGTNYYMVRAERLEVTASGSYYNLSQGIHTYVDGIKRTAGIQDLTSPQFSVYPNPAADHISIRIPQNTTHSGRIINAIGEEVIGDITIRDAQSIDISALKPGMYFMVVDGSVRRFIKI